MSSKNIYCLRKEEKEKVISVEDFVTIKNLKVKNPDMSLREIGRLLHVSHNTIKSALSKEEVPQYQC
ncbi:MAG: helix-turn-helix domain-containing protein [Bacteroidetes bacterium]|nr:helix-turn-helix domain-containing protein [Bacteroidota bacterium]